VQSRQLGNYIFITDYTPNSYPNTNPFVFKMVLGPLEKEHAQELEVSSNADIEKVCNEKHFNTIWRTLLIIHIVPR